MAISKFKYQTLLATGSSLLVIAANLIAPPASLAQHKLAHNNDRIDIHLADNLPLDLALRMAQNPTLMNLDYLQYYIGRPQNEHTQVGIPIKHFYWYDQSQHVQYELIQNHAYPGQVIRSEFVSHMHDQDFDFEEMEAMLGPSARKFHDKNSHTAGLYSLVPGTYLTFASAHDSFHIGQAKVAYSGAPLPPPSKEDMYIAQQAIPARAHIALSQGEHKSAEELLHHRLGEHPGEAQSHYLLGQSYVQQGKIHEAILQYKRALALCGENDQLRANCTQALIDLRVLPDPENPQQISAQNIRFHKNGQSLRTTIISPNQDKDDKEDSTQDNEANSALATTSSKQVQ